MKLKYKIIGLVAGIAMFTTSQAALQFIGGTQVGGTEAGNAVGTANPGTSATSLGATGMTLNLALGENGSTTGSLLGADQGLTADISFSQLVNSFRMVFGGNPNTFSFQNDAALAAGDMLTITLNFNEAIGTWEDGGVNPNGSDVRFATALRTNGTPALGDDTVFQLDLGSAPVSPTGQPAPTAWDLNTTGVNTGTFTSSGAFNEAHVWDFTGVDNSVTNFRSALADGADGATAPWQYTDTVEWKITAGAGGIAANTNFLLTVDGTPAVIPEPSGALLLGVALTGGLFVRRRR